MYVILIDSGTTNTRIRLIKENRTEIIDSEKIKVGIRNTAIEGNNSSLKSNVQSGLKRILARNQLDAVKVKYIIASGMITSNLGIHEVPHITGPAYIENFSKGSVVTKIQGFFDIPWIFTPGLKNNTNIHENDIVERINEFDIMRGEEVETIGLLDQFDVHGEGVVILPGSHTKFIFISEDKALENCLSTLGGEMLFAIQSETILSDSLGKNLIKSLDKENLEKGFQAAEKHGLTRSFYHIRLLQMFSDLNENEISNYFVGSVLYHDLKSLETKVNKTNIKWAIIGGSNPLRSALSHLIEKHYQDWNVIQATDDQMEKAIVIGPLKIAENLMK
ncbi:2-dehydro-3-deoxygalactonokinase [Oceanobacillus sp. CAU 1775]